MPHDDQPAADLTKDSTILAGGASALLVLIILAIVFHGDDSGNASPPTTLPVTPAGVLRAHDAAGQLTLDGPVKTADERKAVDAAAADRFGKDNVLDRLQVQATADSAAWLATAIAALPRKDAGFGAIDVTSTKAALTITANDQSKIYGDTLALGSTGYAVGGTLYGTDRVTGVTLAPRPSRHQMLIPTPYPRKLGPNAAGNPRITQPRRHQRLVPAPYPRQYR